ncbi:sensor histidine kinase [Dactylosporangium sp. CA-233914]|uniref:sensor histidine kinase n=1 Tax=Dactylosporangium sp. CA-233914 TaxID=3239934 RepID=UPI003D8B3619
MNLGRVRAGVRDFARGHPVLADAGLAVVSLIAVVAADAVLEFGDPPLRQAGLPGLAAIVLAVAAIVVRRRFTTAAVVTCVAAGHLSLVLGFGQQPVLVAALGVLFYTFAMRTDRRRAWLVALAAMAVLVAGGLIGHATPPEAFGAVSWIVIGAAIGDATRNRQAYAAEAERRLRQAEQAHDEEIRLRIARERLGIARDLHDLIAHHIAAVKVQATGAQHVLRTFPEQVEPALEHIVRSTDTILREMGAVVALLRTDDGGNRAPSPGLAQLTGLLDDVEATGLHIERRQIGAARQLPELIDLAAYRIVQEGLTNARKHGDGSAALTLTFSPDALRIDVVNRPGVKPSPTGTGYGIIGMGERVAAHGGRFEAGTTPDGRFAVHVMLPVPAAEVTR